MSYEIRCKNQLLAIVVPHEYKQEGITFFTDGNLSQQLAYMQHPKGHRIDAHIHNLVKREVQYTKETLVIRKGKLRVDFYDDEQNYVKSILVQTGDVILLVSGGHGFQVLEDTEMIEIKQGPYIGDKDKTRFAAIRDEDVVIQ